MSGSGDDFDTGRYRRQLPSTSSHPQVPGGLLRGVLTGVILAFLLFFAWATLGLILVIAIGVIVLLWLFWSHRTGATGAAYFPGIALGLMIVFVLLFFVP